MRIRKCLKMTFSSKLIINIFYYPNDPDYAASRVCFNDWATRLPNEDTGA